MLIRSSLSGAVAALLFASAAQSAPLNDTGQVRCFDATVTSTGTVGVDSNPESAGFVGQDCSYGGSAADAEGVFNKIGGSGVFGRDYTKIANDGSELPSNATLGSGASDWRCTRDNTTGLTWLLRLGGEQTATYSYAQASTLVTAANSDAACGMTDWSLPQPAQFESLFAYHDPAGSNNLIDRTWFPDQTNPGAFFFFWTQASQDGVENYWVADFGTGQMTSDLETNPAFVRLVSGTQSTTSPRFSTDEPLSNGEVVVEDADTGLMWKQCPDGLSGASCANGAIAFKDWSTALIDAGSESYAGFDDWRLPNINELASIRDYTPTGFGVVTLPSEFLGDDTNYTYWSSTNVPLAASATSAIAYRFEGSQAHSPQGKGNSIAVRLVRGGGFPAQYVAGSDITPDAFSFADADTAVSTLVESADITVSGIEGAAPISVSGAAESAYSLDQGSSWASLPGTVSNGATVRVRHRAAATTGSTATTTLAIGGESADFVSTAASVPDAPVISLDSVGDGQVDLSFTEPANNGSAVTSYTANVTPDGDTTTTQACGAPPTTSCQLTGLSNGIEHTITLVATNGLGDSTASNSVVATPVGLPGAPQGLNPIQTGLTSARVEFSQYDDGGSPVIGYTVTLGGDGSGTQSCSSPPCEISGLAAGGNYTVSVFATNAIGDGAASPAVDLALVTAPAIAEEGVSKDGDATFTVTAPANAGAGFANEYRFVFASEGGGTTEQTVTAAADQVSFTGLPVGELEVSAFAQLNDAGRGINGESPLGQSTLRMLATPTIAIVGNPATLYDRNHNGGFVDLSKPDIILAVDDPDSLQAPVFSLSSSNSTLLPTQRERVLFLPLLLANLPGVVTQQGSEVASDGSQRWDIALQPALNLEGSSLLTFTVVDADGLSASEAITIQVDSDSAPTATYVNDSDSLPAYPDPSGDSFGYNELDVGSSQAGTPYTRPGFVLSSSAIESDQAITSFEVVAVEYRLIFNEDAENRDEFPYTRVVSDVTSEVLPAVDVATGTLTIGSVPERNDIFLGESLGTTLYVWPVDDGSGDASICTGENRFRYAIDFQRRVYSNFGAGYQIDDVIGPCGAPRTIELQSSVPSLLFSGPAGQSVSPPSPLKTSEAEEAQVMLYRVVVNNIGGDLLEEARLVIRGPSGMRDVSWTCEGSAVPCSSATGVGDVDVGISLRSSEGVQVDLVGTLEPSAGAVSLKPIVLFGDGEQAFAPENGGRFVDIVSNDYIFADRLEQ